MFLFLYKVYESDSWPSYTLTFISINWARTSLLLFAGVKATEPNGSAGVSNMSSDKPFCCSWARDGRGGGTVKKKNHKKINKHENKTKIRKILPYPTHWLSCKIPLYHLHIWHGINLLCKLRSHVRINHY